MSSTVARQGNSRELMVASPGLYTPGSSFGIPGLIPGIGGRERGISARGDIVTQTANGVDINTLWNEFQASLAILNEKRDSMVRFLTYSVSVPYEELYQAGSTAQFETASEFGEPVGYRPERPTTALMGYSFKWRDLAFRYTWNYLADVSSGQLQADNGMALEADSREIYATVMETLFGNARRANREGQVVYPFYNGQSIDAMDTPPVYGATKFAAGHNHFLTTGSATLAPQDVEALEGTITEHGYKKRNGNQLILMVTKTVGDQMRLWRSTVNGGTGKYDFIPALGTPAYLLPVDPRLGDGQSNARPSDTYQGFDVIGTYGELLVLQEDYIPSGYLVCFATGGQESLPNPVAFREHSNASLRGLRLVKGRTPDYPLVDSFYNRGFGTGVRHRGAAAVLQITAGTYTVPNFRG